MGKRERMAKAAEYLDLVGLSDRANHYPSSSRAVCQRVGLARASRSSPRLLMDEPFAALDAQTRETCRTCCSATAPNATMVFVTHSIDEAIFLSDRMVVMGVPGRVIEAHTVHLPRPRADYDWRSTEEYTQLRTATWSVLRAEIERPSPPRERRRRQAIDRAERVPRFEGEARGEREHHAHTAIRRRHVGDQYRRD